jgi:hypothetical protein
VAEIYQILSYPPVYVVFIYYVVPPDKLARKTHSVLLPYIFLSQTADTAMSIGDMNNNVNHSKKEKKSPEIVLKY